MTGSLFDPLAAPFRLEGDNDEAVVLQHGFTSTPALFRPLATVLHDAGYTVEVPLLAGHGTSLDDMARHGWREWRDSMRRGIEQVADHRAIHLVGHSLGGLLAILLAREVGAASLATINSPVRLRDRFGHVKAPLAPFLARRQPLTLWPEEGPPDLDEEVRPYWLTYPGFATARAADLFAVSLRAIRAARRVTCRSLVIQSLVDETVDPRSAFVLARALGPGCRIEWLERSFHNATLGPERDRIHRVVIEHLRAASG